MIFQQTLSYLLLSREQELDSNSQVLDYYNRIPVYERDNFYNIISDLAFPITANSWDLYFEGEYLREGKFIQNSKKNPLVEYRARGGIMYHIGGRNDHHSILVDVGYVFREGKYLHDAEPKDQVLIRINWQNNYEFGENFSF